MESVSVVSVIALRARLDRESPEPSVAARVAHRVSVALVQHVAAKCFPALVFAEADGRLAALTNPFASRGRCGSASAPFSFRPLHGSNPRAYIFKPSKP
jgi:hypothetical protein